MKLNEIISRNSEEMVETLKELLRIPSVAQEPEEGAPNGRDVADALEFMLERADKMGFRTVNFDGQVGYCEYGKGEQIAVVAHLDVVPAGDGWTFDPFGGREEGGRIYGRGAVDDKGPAVACLYALNALKESGLPVHKRIRILFGTSEETGSADMKYYFEHGGEKPVCGFTPDGSYPVIHGEKGIVIATLEKHYSQSAEAPKLRRMSGGTAFNVVPAQAFAEIECNSAAAEEFIRNHEAPVFAEITEYGMKIRSEGVSAHGSTPEKGVNAVALLIHALCDIPFSPELSETLRFLDERIGSETDGAGLGIALRDPISGGLTLNLGTIRGDEGRMGICINYRYPVTFRLEDCAPAFNEAFTENGFHLVSQKHEPALYVDPESTLVRTLLDVYNEQTGREEKAFCIGGGTYAKSVPNIVAFGPVFPEDPDREHKPDECIERENLILNARIYAHAMYRLAR